MSGRDPTDDVREAAKISCGACDFCPAIHVDLKDAAGETFATASVPLHNAEAFIGLFRAAMTELATRHSAPARKQ